VRILETRAPQQTQQRANYNQNTSSQGYSASQTSNAYSKEHEAAKRQVAEKERRRLELQKKLKQTPKRADNDIDDEEINNASRQLQQMKTYTEARGYLSNAPGFNRDLTQYIEDDENQQQPEPVSIKTSSKSNTTTTTTNTSVFRKVEERSDGPKYVPSEDLPPQYKTGPWKCHSCCTNNGADRQKCNMCGTLRGEMSISLDDASNTPGGEWNCPACKVLNSPSRNTCIMCGSKFRPTASPGKSDSKKDPHKDPKKTTPAGGVKKKAIVTKAGSGIELQYAKGVDKYKNGGFIPGHGAGY